MWNRILLIQTNNYSELCGGKEPRLVRRFLHSIQTITIHKHLQKNNWGIKITTNHRWLNTITQFIRKLPNGNGLMLLFKSSIQIRNSCSTLLVFGINQGPNYFTMKILLNRNCPWGQRKGSVTNQYLTMKVYKMRTTVDSYSISTWSTVSLYPLDNRHIPTEVLLMILLSRAQCSFPTAHEVTGFSPGSNFYNFWS